MGCHIKIRHLLRPTFLQEKLPDNWAKVYELGKHCEKLTQDYRNSLSKKFSISIMTQIKTELLD